MPTLPLLIAALLAQSPDATAALQRAADAAQRAAEAAERAAAAAQKAAEANHPSAAPAEAASKAVEAAAKSVEAAKAAAPPNPVTWTGTVALGLIALTGNSQTLTFSSNGAFERKSPDWIWGIKASAAYGQTTAPGASSQVTAYAAGVQARGDRRFNEQLSLYLLLGIDTDHLKSIEARPIAELGVALLWFDEKVGDLQKSSLRTDLGFRYGREYRFQYYPTQENPPDVDIVAPRLGLAYRYAVNKDVIFTEEASVLANLVGDTSGRTLIGSTSRLSSRLTERVSLGVGFTVAYDSQPPAGKVNTDTALTVGLEVGL